jgi:RNA polymerase sigma-70 factor (ECF subfamily)
VEVGPEAPLPSRYQGRTAILAFLLETSLSGDAVGRWRLLPIRANGLPGFAFYVRDENTGKYLPFALQVLSSEGDLLSNVTTFGTPGLYPDFNLPADLTG